MWIIREVFENFEVVLAVLEVSRTLAISISYIGVLALGETSYLLPATVRCTISEHTKLTLSVSLFQELQLLLSFRNC